MNSTCTSDDAWLFGYGSLVWKAGFPFAERRIASVRGWARRFWQGSADHRGTPDAPGRVATLVPHPLGEVWGVAYRLQRETQDAVLADLDIREKGGYERTFQTLRGRDGAVITRSGVVYVGDEGNAHYAGRAHEEDIAALILHREGPSGHNAEYLLRLADQLVAMDVDDEHVATLSDLVRREAGRELRDRFADLF